MIPSTPSEQLVFDAYSQRYGERFARKWLKDKRQNKTTEFPEAPRPRRDDPAARAIAAFKRSLLPNNPIKDGEIAINKAAVILAPDRQGLGLAYPLVLALVAMALEAGHDPDTDSANSYHCLATFDSLGFIAARAVGRHKPFCAKTIQRWLHGGAEHAHVLRHYIGLRLWYTDTLINYSTNTSIGKVVGGHVVRVYTRSLGGVVNPHKDALERQWRNLEADIKGGYTRAQADVSNVHIGGTTLRDIAKTKLPLYDLTTPGESKTTLLEDYYNYPDIRQPEGAKQLRFDVEDAALKLCRHLEPDYEAGWNQRANHYRRAVWVAVKHDMIHKDHSGIDLLKRAIRMAHELQITSHTLKSPAAFIWHLIEEAGFKELRRDCPVRLIPQTVLKQISAI